MPHEQLISLSSVLLLTAPVAGVAQDERSMPPDPAKQTPSEIIAQAENVRKRGLRAALPVWP